jgi:hypothetical protein
LIDWICETQNHSSYNNFSFVSHGLISSLSLMKSEWMTSLQIFSIVYFVMFCPNSDLLSFTHIAVSTCFVRTALVLCNYFGSLKQKQIIWILCTRSMTINSWCWNYSIWELCPFICRKLKISQVLTERGASIFGWHIYCIYQSFWNAILWSLA